MLRFLLWINKKIMLGSQKMNKRLEQKMLSKQLCKKMRKKGNETTLLTCREGLVLVIREDALDVSLQEWLKRNVLEEEYTIVLWAGKTETGSENQESEKDTIDIEREEQKQSLTEPQAKLSNLRIALQTTDGVKYVEMNEQQPMKKRSRSHSR